MKVVKAIFLMIENNINWKNLSEDGSLSRGTKIRQVDVEETLVFI
jgi:hypothetical protein